MKKYAPFFESCGKERKELGVVEEWLAALNQTSHAGYHSAEVQRPDPPDCICLNASGGRVAVEVTEIVCNEAARLTAQGKQVVRVWRRGELRTRVALALSKKDGSTFYGQPYAEKIVCLFTDEPMVSLRQVTAELAAALFGPYNQLTSAFFLLSYDPNTKTYPVVPLKLCNHA